MDPRPRWLIVEPYFGGSHRSLVEGLQRELDVDFELWSLPARKWKWRMRGSALAFAERAREQTAKFDGVFVSSMTNVAELRGLLPRAWSELPWIVYFHENQLRYPVQHFDARDHHFAWTNVVTAEAADRLLFNSAFNRDSFADDLEALLRKMPDARPQGPAERIRRRGEVLPVPIDDSPLLGLEKTPREGPCHVVWNHRWEFDKGPELLLRAVRAMADCSASVHVSILGQSFRTRPPLFDEIASTLGDRLQHFGPIEDRREYWRVLSTADVALSTAIHEFQGLAVLEAARAGAVPLVPDRLAYRETWPRAWRYADEDLEAALLDRIENVARWREEDPSALAHPFTWSDAAPHWRALFQRPLAAG